ncbi:MAG: hypothetical protein HYZ37_03735 [Candidatus Solibacter usitatus]|nr:hypothetical protein [Candidatus Solibacter usitatus]
MKSPTVSMVGGDSLLGKEVREVLRQRGHAWPVQFLRADEEEASKLTEIDGEAVVVSAMNKTNLALADLIVLADTPASSRKAWELTAKNCDAHIVDLTGELSDVSRAKRLKVIGHPAAATLGIFHDALAKTHKVARWSAHIFEPASQRGLRGIDELHQQTIKLFAFQTLPREVYDAQLAYAMLPAWGPDANAKLIDAELQVERSLADILAVHKDVPMPSLRLVQAPAFHGYSISVWAELAGETDVEGLTGALREAGLDVRDAGEPPSNPGIAGQSGIAVGDIRPDRNHPRAFWFWLVSDNLRLTAESAVDWMEQTCAKN